MKIISLATLTAISLGSLTYPNPAQAILLRFTGFSSNGQGAEINFDIDEDVNLLTLSDGFYSDIVSNISLNQLAFFSTADDPAPPELQRSYFSNAGDLQVSSLLDTDSLELGPTNVAGGFVNKKFILTFNASLAQPAVLDQPDNIDVILQLGLANLLDPSSSVSFDESALFDAAIFLEFPSFPSIDEASFDYVPQGADFSVDILEIGGNSTDIPEAYSLLSFLLFSGMTGIGLLLKRYLIRMMQPMGR